MTQIIGAGCFRKGTYVRTPDGVQVIESLKEGDYVVSFDDKGDLHEAKVLKVHCHEDEQVYTYRFWGGDSFTATPNHWVLNQFNSFTAIGSLGGDDCVVDVNNHLLPIVAKADEGLDTVYNLTVEGQHTFIANNIRVHNAGLGLGIGGTRKIIGAGGGGGGKGGGGGHTPSTSPDSLDSKSFANVLDLISEGECQGLKDGMKSVFFDNTPLENSDGSSNFDNVTLKTREGTASQSLIEGFDKATTTVSVSAEVKKTISVTRTVATSNSTNAVRVIIRIPSLQNVENNGDIVGTSVRFKIFLIINSGTPQEKIDDTISGRTGDLYKKDYLITLPTTSFSSAEIRIVRETNDSSNPRLGNETWWDSYVKITYTNNTYPNSALCGIRVNAEQFNSIPQRAYLYRGIKTRIPSNATVDNDTGALIYSGIWNGTFSAAVWHSDPCWCLWDLLTSVRYGIGSHILTATEQASFNGNASRLDKWAFYSASKYCSANNTRPSNSENNYGSNGKHGVEDGFGLHEPRFSCNINIQGRGEAFTLINSMASVFRGMPYWSTGSLTVAQDKTQTSAFLFTLANVSEAGFSYAGSSQKTRTTVAVVKYFDTTLRSYAYEEVKDTDAIARYGVITKNIEAFACTSRGQAHRVGKWLLYSEGNETETITFTTSLEAGIVCRPGQVIDVSDPVKSGVRRGGRIKGNRVGSYTQTGTTITVDCAGHGLINGQSVSINFVDGGADGDDGTFTAGSISSDGFTVTSSTSRTASGSLILNQAPTSTTIMVDGSSSNTNLPPNGVSYTRTLHVVNAGGMVETREISSITGSVITVSSAFDMTPVPNDVWVIETTGGTSAENIQTTQWRVISVTEEDGVEYQVTALSYNSSKYGYVEEGLSLTQRDFTNLNELPATPGQKLSGTYSRTGTTITVTFTGHGFTSSDVGRFVCLAFSSGNGTDNSFAISSVPDANTLTFTDTNSGTTSGNLTLSTLRAFQQLYTKGNSILTKIIFSWDSVSGVNEYEVRWRKDLGNWNVSRQQSPDAEIRDVTTGTYDFKVFSLNGARIPSTEPLAGTLICVGKTRPPSQVTGFTFELAPFLGLTLSWNKLEGVYPHFDDLDVVGYEIRTSDAHWALTNNSNLVARVTANSYKIGTIPTGTQAYFIKALDSEDNYSTTATSQSITVGAPNTPSFNTSETKIEGESAVLVWGAVSIANKYGIDYYEVYKGGTTSSHLLGQISTTRFTTPVMWSGDKEFYVKAVDIAGNSSVAANITVTNTPAGAPTIDSTYVDDTLVLNWSEVNGSIPTRAYEVRQGNDWDGASIKGRVKATEFTLPVTWSTTQTFWVAAVNTVRVGTSDLDFFGAEGSKSVTFTHPGTPTVASAFVGENIQLTWTPVTGSLPVAEYEIKRGNSSQNFNDAHTNLGRHDFTTFTAKVDWGGTRETKDTNGNLVVRPQDQKFWVRAIDVRGNAGTADSETVTVGVPTSPTTLTQEVIDNNVLLRWSDATNSLPIIYYSIKRQSSVSEPLDTAANFVARGTDIGAKQGKFTTVFETTAGTFTYWIAGIDSADNVGVPKAVTASVNQPPDYVLRSDINSTFGGSKTNVFTEGGKLFANVNTSKTWEDHFDDMSWTTLQDQETASGGIYNIYALPSETSGSYIQEVDHGTVLAGTKVVLAMTAEHAAGQTTTTPTISVKETTGGSWTNFPGQATTDSNVTYSVFATNFRYVKYTLNFTSSGNDDLLKITALNLRLETKQKSDAGAALARLASSGTYSQSAKVLTVNQTNHGRIVGEVIDLNMTSGSTPDGVYYISGVPNANAFTCELVLDSNNAWVDLASATNSGNVTLDDGGTAVAFNTTFVDLEAVTITPSGGSAPRIALYDFVDAPNPKIFKAFLYDTDGTRVGGTSGTNFSWQVRGS